MGKQSKRTRAPEPPGVPPSAPYPVPPAAPHLVLPPVHQLVPSSTFPSTQGPGAWIPPLPPQSMAASSSAPCWPARLQQPSAAGAAAQGPCWAPSAGVGGSASPWFTHGNMNDSDLEACRGLDSHPPGGFLSFFKNTSSHSQVVSNGTSPRPINGDDTNGGDCVRTEKRLPWTKQEDRRLMLSVLSGYCSPVLALSAGLHVYGRERVLEG